MEEIIDGKKTIRKWSWVLLVFFFLGLIMIIGLASFLGTLDNLITSWLFYVSSVIFLLSLIGLFMYKKWGFYLFTLYLIYLLIDNIIQLNYRGLIIFAIIYGYIIWYKGFYKNFLHFE